MKKLVILISGRRCAGKNTFANLVAAHVLDRRDMHATVDKDGILVMRLPDGDSKISNDFLLSQGIRISSFAEPLKLFCINVLGLESRQVWGTDADKESLTQLKWDDLPIGIRWKYANRKWWKPRTWLATGFMTARRVMQVWGTDIVRKSRPNAWVAAAFQMAKESKCSVVMFPDTRFPNELQMKEMCLKEGIDCRAVMLRRKVTDDTHISELAILDMDANLFEINMAETSGVQDYERAVVVIVNLWLKTNGIIPNGWMQETKTS